MNFSVAVIAGVATCLTRLRVRSYDGELRELIHLLKYEQVEPAAMHSADAGRGDRQAGNPASGADDSCAAARFEAAAAQIQSGGIDFAAALKRTPVIREELATNLLVRTRAQFLKLD